MILLSTNDITLELTSEFKRKSSKGWSVVDGHLIPRTISMFNSVNFIAKDKWINILCLVIISLFFK